jgi:sugar phosphate isomerase/epimerase
MRLSLTDNTFRLLHPWERVLDLARLLEVPAVDVCIMGARSHLRPEDVRDDIPGTAERIAAGLAERSLALSDLFCIPWVDFERYAPNHPDAAERERSDALFADLLELAVRSGAPGMTMLPGIPWPGEPAEASFARSVEALRRRVSLARERGVRFSIEPHLGSVAQHPQDAARLCAEAEGLELTLDYSHFVYQGFGDEDIEPLAALARHVHVRGAARARMQAPLHASSIDFERMVGALRAAGYAGDLSLEYLWIAWEGLNECDTVSETILLRDRLLAALEGRPWQYPRLAI